MVWPDRPRPRPTLHSPQVVDQTLRSTRVVKVRVPPRTQPFASRGLSPRTSFVDAPTTLGRSSSVATHKPARGWPSASQHVSRCEGSRRLVRPRLLSSAALYCTSNPPEPQPAFISWCCAIADLAPSIRSLNLTSTSSAGSGTPLSTAEQRNVSSRLSGLNSRETHPLTHRQAGLRTGTPLPDGLSALRSRHQRPGRTPVELECLRQAPSIFRPYGQPPSRT